MVVMYSLCIVLSWFEFKKYIKGISLLQGQLTEVMFLYGTGYKDLVHAISTNVKEYQLS